MGDLICYVLGVLLVLIATMDVFLTVLCARSGFRFLSAHVNKGIYIIFHHAARVFYGQKDTILSFCGPFLMIFNLVLWAVMMVIGFALIIWPQLGEAVTASQGPTGQGFWVAIFYSGYNFTTLGIGNLIPRNDFFRFLTVLESGMGFTYFTMTITYFLSVYNALQRRNTFALALHHKTNGTADAGNYISELVRTQQIQEISRELSQIAQTMGELLESHHLYPILHYFRFKETRHALPRILVICMETATFAKSLKKGSCSVFKQTTSTDQIWISATDLLSTLSRYFLPKIFHKHIENNDHIDTSLFQRRFLRVIEQMRPCLPEPDAPMEKASQMYTQLRKHWNSSIIAFCHSQVYTRDEIMPYEREM